MPPPTPSFLFSLPPFAFSTHSQSPKCSRRTLLLSLPVLVLPALLTCPTRAAEPPSAATDARAQVSAEVSLPDFAQMLETGQVTALWFYGPTADYCAFQTADGSFAHIAHGYPNESPRSPESPLHIAARARELGVPYFMVPIHPTFLRR